MESPSSSSRLRNQPSENGLAELVQSRQTDFDEPDWAVRKGSEVDERLEKLIVEMRNNCAGVSMPEKDEVTGIIHIGILRSE